MGLPKSADQHNIICTSTYIFQSTPTYSKTWEFDFRPWRIILDSVVWTIAVPVTWGSRVVTTQVLRFSLHINWLEGYKWNIVRHVITKSEFRLEIPLYKSKHRVHMTMFIVLVSNANNLPKIKNKKNTKKNPTIKPKANSQ